MNALILQNNLVEIRSDSFKLLKMMKRPVPHMVGSIGAWMNIFQVGRESMKATIRFTGLSVCFNDDAKIWDFLEH